MTLSSGGAGPLADGRAVAPAPGKTSVQVADARVTAIDSPVVVELFTSQGCYSCPPADSLLGELAGEPNVIAMSLHVDYWDYIGWKDIFASAENTERQRRYASALNLRYVYTPQMVIDGRHNVVGSRTGEVRSTLAKAATSPKPVRIDILLPSEAGQIAKAVIPATDLAELLDSEEASIWMAAYDSAHSVDIRRGENSGKKLTYHNVVRELKPLARWDGEQLEVPLDLAGLAADGRDGCAIWIQKGVNGPIIGAAAIALGDAEG